MQSLSSVRSLVTIHQLLRRYLGNELLLLGNKMDLWCLLATTHERAAAMAEWETVSTHITHPIHTHREAAVVLCKRIIMVWIKLLLILVLTVHWVMLRRHVFGCCLADVSL
jgi:hypothetical protein